MKPQKQPHPDFFRELETIGAAQKNKSESVIVRVVLAHKLPCLDARIYKQIPGVEEANGSCYTQKGLCLRPEVARELIRLLEEGLKRLPQTADQEKDAPANV